MGSRRKRKDERSSNGTSNITRQARIAPITGKHTRIEPKAEAPLATSQSTHSGASHSARPTSDTNKHARLGLVTKQAEDGSFELVYGNLDEDDALDPHHEVDEPSTVSPWRSRVGLLVLGGLIGLFLFVGLIATAIWWFQDGGAADKRRVISQNNQTAAPAETNKARKAYQYVPPKEVKGRVNLDTNDKAQVPATTTTKSTVNTKNNTLNANPPANIPGPSKKPGTGIIPSRGLLGTRMPNVSPVLRNNPLLKGSLNKRLRAGGFKKQGEDDEEDDEEEIDEEEEEEDEDDEDDDRDNEDDEDREEDEGDGEEDDRDDDDREDEGIE